MASLKVACVVLMMCMIVAPMADAATSCGQVSGALAPCIAYLKGGPGTSAACCGGVKRLNRAAAYLTVRQLATA